MTEKSDPYSGPRVEDTGDHVPFVRPASPFKGLHENVSQKLDFGKIHRKRAIHLTKPIAILLVGIALLVFLLSVIASMVFEAVQASDPEDQTPLREKFYKENK